VGEKSGQILAEKAIGNGGQGGEHKSPSSGASSHLQDDDDEDHREEDVPAGRVNAHTEDDVLKVPEDVGDGNAESTEEEIIDGMDTVSRGTSPPGDQGEKQNRPKDNMKAPKDPGVYCPYEKNVDMKGAHEKSHNSDYKGCLASQTPLITHLYVFELVQLLLKFRIHS
jgi:hypothetical protein